MARIIKFHEAAEVMTNGMELKGGEGAPLDNPELCLEEADIFSMKDPEEDDIFDFEGNIDSPAEVTEIWMPSWVASGHIMDDVVLALRQEELELRKGQANNCLEKLRQALGDRSVVGSVSTPKASGPSGEQRSVIYQIQAPPIPPVNIPTPGPTPCFPVHSIPPSPTMHEVHLSRISPATSTQPCSALLTLPLCPLTPYPFHPTLSGVPLLHPIGPPSPTPTPSAFLTSPFSDKLHIILGN
ncbi:uncharacterized protein EDB91DRAFT_1257079 [Suillus paluster]|uniref:uncharacterized protein n=1 Tax=Suillus paluster TaxID=48578 RepID=UPI001B87D51F|nr:uncharacterized protein EDB91DRAFT_1257079 [Suillus paluster]KAG1720228.1 hypothetical protein EDB91DRAFT_1257079 [Suillus paluster]